MEGDESFGVWELGTLVTLDEKLPLCPFQASFILLSARANLSTNAN